MAVQCTSLKKDDADLHDMEVTRMIQTKAEMLIALLIMKRSSLTWSAVTLLQRARRERARYRRPSRLFFIVLTKEVFMKGLRKE